MRPMRPGQVRRKVHGLLRRLAAYPKPCNERLEQIWRLLGGYEWRAHGWGFHALGREIWNMANDLDVWRQRGPGHDDARELAARCRAYQRSL